MLSALRAHLLTRSLGRHSSGELREVAAVALTRLAVNALSPLKKLVGIGGSF